MSSGAPLSFSPNPRLDSALARGGAEWLEAARAVGVRTVIAWLRNRADLTEQLDDVREAVAALLGATDDEEAAILASELAELVTGDDDGLAAALAEVVLAHGLAVGDAEIIADAVTHLAEIAENDGDVLAAAEYHLEFLNWRRRAGASSDAESVLSAFDEIVRLAHLDGAAEAAAQYQYRQVAFQRLVEADDERATTGDWEPARPPYESWA